MKKLHLTTAALALIGSTPALAQMPPVNLSMTDAADVEYVCHPQTWEGDPKLPWDVKAYVSPQNDAWIIGTENGTDHTTFAKGKLSTGTFWPRWVHISFGTNADSDSVGCQT